MSVKKGQLIIHTFLIYGKFTFTTAASQ